MRNYDKEKYASSGYGIAFDRKGPWIFSNDFARNVIISGVDNNSSSDTNNLKNDLLFQMKDIFLVLMEA